MRKIIQQIKQQFKDFTSFNYAERRGIAVLVLIILLVEAGNAFLPVREDFNSIDMAKFKEDIRLFEEALARPDTNAQLKEKRSYTGKKKYPDRYYKSGTAAAKPPMIVEINTADSAQLVGLSGIGPVFANRILKYRGLLGGFYSKEQLMEIYGMDSTRYDKIKEYITNDKSHLHKIDINEAEFKTLLRHPYLDYETVKQIVNYRQNKGPIPHPDTLRLVIGYDPMFEKVRHYIDYGN